MTGHGDHWYRWDNGDLILRVQIQPRASRDELTSVINSHLKVRITAPPVDGEANDHLLRFMAKQFGLPKKKVILLHGHKGKTKVLCLRCPQKIPPGLDVARPG